MSVMTIITTMILMGWFALQSSYSYSTRSSKQRDDARQALSRMQREIRDGETRLLASDPVLSRARAFWVAFYTTFNRSGNTTSSLKPHMVMYRLYSDRTIWRFDDVNNNGAITGVTMNPIPDTPAGWPLSEQQTGEGATLMIRNVVNYAMNPSSPTPLFLYTYYDDSGNLVTADHAYNSTVGGTGLNDRTNTIAVTIRIIDDLVPGQAPIYADLQTTAQLRNQR